MFTCTLRKRWLILVANLAALALTIDSASAQRAGDGSRTGSAGVRGGFAGSEAMRSAPTQGPPMSLPLQSSRATGGVAPTSSSSSAVSTAPKSADPRASAGAAVLLNSTLSASPPAVPSAPTPISVIAAPEGQLQPLARLSSPLTTTTVGTGRASATSTTASPYFSSSAPVSPSQAAPSLPGGGGGTLEDCMGFWDRATHMTKNEWRAACQRTLHRLDDVAREFARNPTPAKPSQ
jgi:hypothetical protein